jgi:uncharacterized Zn finger protein (UPF0148 family)
MNTDKNEKEISPEAKLGDLMMRGWTMLAETCTIPNCCCPLMRNTDGQVYCVGCESWIFESHISPKKQRFGELVSLHGKQNLKVKNEHSEIQLKNEHSELAKMSAHPNYLSWDKNIRGMLEKKLVYLTNLLEKETDINKIKTMLESIHLCSQSINSIKQF